jgi:hypothetical protein
MVSVVTLGNMRGDGLWVIFSLLRTLQRTPGHVFDFDAVKIRISNLMQQK